MKIKNINILICMVAIIIFTLMCNFSIASNPIDNPGGYAPGEIDGTDIEPITDKGAIILNTLTTIGIILSVIVLVILGIKYMLGSVEEKAEYKKTMIPYLVGVFMLAAVTVILRIVVTMVGNLSSTI